MLNKKRGIAAGQLVIIILVVVALVLLGSVSYSFGKEAEKKAPALMCRDTLAFRATNQINVGNIDIPLSAPICETQDKEISGDREEIKQQLADLMAECWWMFHEGKYEEILRDPEIIQKVFGIRGENECFVCHNVLINEKEIEGGIITREELEKYLRETKHRKYKEITYLDYIQSYGGPGSVFVLDNIGPRESYGIVFMAKNKEGDGLAWYDYASGFFAIAYAPIISPIAVVAAGLGPALKAKSEFYDSDERDISVIALDHLKSVNYRDCDSSLYQRT